MEVKYSELVLTFGEGAGYTECVENAREGREAVPTGYGGLTL